MLERMRRKGKTLTLLWECDLVQPLWKTEWRFLKEIKIDLPDDPAITPLGIYPKTQMQGNAGTPAPRCL